MVILNFKEISIYEKHENLIIYSDMYKDMIEESNTQTQNIELDLKHFSILEWNIYKNYINQNIWLSNLNSNEFTNFINLCKFLQLDITPYDKYSLIYPHPSSLINYLYKTNNNINTYLNKFDNLDGEQFIYELYTCLNLKYIIYPDFFKSEGFRNKMLAYIKIGQYLKRMDHLNKQNLSYFRYNQSKFLSNLIKYSGNNPDMIKLIPVIKSSDMIIAGGTMRNA